MVKRRSIEVGMRVLEQGKYQFDYIDADGVRRRPKFYGSRALADNERRLIQDTLEEGRNPANSERRVLDAIEGYLAHYRGKGIRTVRSRIDNHVAPHWGRKYLQAIDREAVQEWVDKVLDVGGRSPATVDAIYSAFSGVMTYARGKRWIVDTPCVAIDRPAISSRKAPAGAVAMVQAIIPKMPPQYQAMAWVAAGAGLRPAEVRGLAVEDIDIEGCVVHVWRQLESGGFHVSPTFDTPKGSKGKDRTRDVHVHPHMIECLEKHLASHHVSNTWTDHKGKRISLVFTNEGWPVGVDRLQRAWSDAWEDARVTEGDDLAHFHDLRHVYGDLLADAGTPTFHMKAQMGHRNITSTEKYVSSPERRTVAAESTARLFTVS